MLTIFSNRSGRFCDKVTRRSFLRIGSLGLGGLSLSDILLAQSQSPAPANDRSVVMIYLPGGPTQHETFDPKPHAPAEIRGPLGTINTRVPGVQFCELLPRLSQLADKFAIVRTLTGMKNRHECFQCYTGRPGGRSEDDEPAGGWPALGSVVSRIHGPSAGGIPAYVDASPKMGYGPYNQRGQHDASSKVSWPGFTGIQHAPFFVEGDIRTDLVLSGIDLSRLGDRRALLTSFDRFRRGCDTEGVDCFQQQAFGLLTSNRLANALDLTREDPRVRERYGEIQQTDPSYGGGPQSPQHLLLVRRLVEAGVRCVTLAFGAWDWHANGEPTIESLARQYLPVFDHAISVFVQDLDERGLLDHTLVVVWGEFGRTPRINVDGGRDHWPETQSILLAGGGIQGGRVVGTTDRSGAVPVERPVHVQEVFATLYHNLGIDTDSAQIPDLSGRPQYLVEANRQPIRELY